MFEHQHRCPTPLAALFCLLIPFAACSDDTQDLEPVPPNNQPNNDPNNQPNNDPTGNRAPTLERIGSKRAQVGRETSFVVEATDPDGDDLTFSIFGELPEGAKFDKETHRFTWTPVQEQLDQLVLLTFAASDGNLDDRETVQMTVVEPGNNGAPDLVDPGDQILRPGEPFELQLVATDPDGDELSFTIDGPSPQGSTLDAGTGLFRWTPQANDAGANIRVIFVAQDGEDRDDVRVKLVVTELELTLGDIGALEVALGDTIDLVLPIDNPADFPTECATLGATLPGTSFAADTCTFTWTPTDESLVGTTTEFAFQVIFEDNGEQARLIAIAPITVVEGNPVVGEECEDDVLEPNDVLEDATLIETNTFSGRALTICDGDRDIFSIDLTEGDSLSISLTFQHSEGDIDLALFLDGREAPLSRANSITDNESITLTEAPETGTYFLLVVEAGGQETDYDIEVERTSTSTCPNEDSEPNNDRDSAAPIDRGLLAEAMICPSDVDFYAIELEAGKLLRATTSFDEDHDLDLTIFAPNGESWSSAGVDDEEEIIIPAVPVDGTYFIKVFGFLDRDTSSYVIEVISAEGSPCTADDFEPNDEAFDATDINPNPEANFEGLSACGDPDFYRVALNTGDELLVQVTPDDDAHTMRLRLLASDASTLLAESTLEEGEGVIFAETGNFLDAFDVFILIDSASGVSYNLETLVVPATE